MSGEDIVIIGAGPCGLTLSHLHPDRTLIIEQDDTVGGLCRSLEFEGAVFDIGGHSFHSPHPEVTDFVENLMGARWVKQRRDARVMFNGALIDYPFQQNTAQISDRAIREACERGPLSEKPAPAPTNLHDWIVRTFGDGVAEHFMLPYNQKLWARDLHDVSCEWVGERVAPKGGAAPLPPQTTRTPLQAFSQVAYPADGGFGEIFEALAQRCGPIELSQRVIAVDTALKTITTDRGLTRRWDRLVSTMPLPDLLATIVDCPKHLIDEASSLQFVSLKVVMIAAAEAITDQPQRIYSADADVPAHKIAFNHTSSPYLRRRASQGIICEVSYSPYKPARPDAEVQRIMVDWLKSSKLISSATEISAVRTIDVKYGYPVLTKTLAKTRARIFDYLESKGIHSIGRFGGWDYINSDACIWKAMQLSKDLKASF